MAGERNADLWCADIIEWIRYVHLTWIADITVPDPRHSIESHGIAPERIVAYGESLGSGQAVRLAASASQNAGF
jgi:hypothetical protein